MLLLLAGALLMAQPGDELAANGGIETLHDGWPVDWSRGWSRDGADKIVVEVSHDQPHGGANCLSVRHLGERDWSLSAAPTLSVRTGDVYAVSCWVRVSDRGEVTLCAALLPPQGEQGAQWTAGGQTVRGPLPDWRRLQGVFVVPEGLVKAQPRLIGQGPVECQVDDFSVIYRGNLGDLRQAYTGPAEAILQGTGLDVRYRPAEDRLVVTDRRTQRTWRGVGETALVPLTLATEDRTLQAEFDPVVRSERLIVRYELTR